MPQTKFKRATNRNASRSANARRKSQLRADIERSRSPIHRDCCVKKHKAIELENNEQRARIAA